MFYNIFSLIHIPEGNQLTISFIYLCQLSVTYSCHIVTKTWVNIDSGDGLLPDDTEPLFEPVLTHYQMCSVAFNWE